MGGERARGKEGRERGTFPVVALAVARRLSLFRACQGEIFSEVKGPGEGILGSELVVSRGVPFDEALSADEMS